METGVVITQEPVFTKTSVEEAHAGVVLDHSTMHAEKVNLSTVLDDSSMQGSTEVAEVVNRSETEESKHEKEEVMKTISVVEDSKIVKEKEETDEQGTVFDHEPKNTDDAKVILTDMTLEKEKEDDTTQKPEEVSVKKPVIEEGETETKNSQEEEKDISKVLATPIKTDEEKDSRTVETSVNGTEAEHSETVSVEEFTGNDENIVKETDPEQDVETTESLLVEEEKDETETVNTVVKNPEIVNNEETTGNDLKENEDAVEAIKNSDDAEQVSREVTGDKEKEEDIIIHKEAEVQVTPIETPTIQGEDIEPKASKETEEHGHVLVRDIPQDETLVPKAETVDTSTVQDSAVLKTLETKSGETDAEPSLDLKEEEETLTPSDEVQETSKVVTEPPKPSPEQKSKDTEEDEHVLGRNMPQGEAESLVTKEDGEQEDKEEVKTEKFEVQIDLALKVDREELMDEKKEADQVAGAQSIERGLALNESEAEETPAIKHPDVESGEQMEKRCLESPSKLSEETRKTLDEKIQEKPEKEVASHQEGQEEGSYGSETVPAPESIEIKEKSQEGGILDAAPLQEEPCLPIERDEEVKSDEVIQVSSASPEGETLVEAKKHEVIKANEEEVADKIQSILETVDSEPVKSNEETTVHESISLKDDSDPVEVIKNSDDAEKVSHEVTGDREKEEDINIHKSQEVQESLTVVETPTFQGENIELKASKDSEEHENVLVRDIAQEETLVPKAETVITSTVQDSSEPSVDLKEQEETVKTVTPSDEVRESITLMEPPKLSPEQISKDNVEDEHVSERNMPQGEIVETEAESLVSKEDVEQIMDLKEDKEQEKTEKLEEVPSDLALKVDKEEVMDEKKEVDEVAAAQNMERGLKLNESEAAELVDQNITDETEEKLVEKPSLESPSDETSKTLDEKIQEKPEEEVSPHQEVQERVSVPESSEVEEKVQEERSLDLTPLQEESCSPTEQEMKEQIHKHEQENDEVTQVSSASPEGETVVEAKKKEEIKPNEEEQVVADKIQSSLEIVDTEPVKSNEDDIAESLNSAGEEIQTKSKDGENVETDETGEEKASRTPETYVNGTEDEHNATVLEKEVLKNNESIVPEKASEEIKNSDEAEENSPEVTGDREKEEDIITRKTTEEMQESQNLLLQEENTTMEHQHELVRDVPQIDTLVTEAEDVKTSTVHKFESNEAEAGQDTEPSFDLKEDKEKVETETVISSDEVRPSDQVDDLQTEESVEVKSKETLQVGSTEEKHDNLLDVPSEDSEKLQPETESQDKTEDIPSELVLKEELKDDNTKVDVTHVKGEMRDLEPEEPEADQIDQTKTDEKVLVESVEKMQTSSLECPSEVSEEKSTTVDEKKKEEEEEEEEVTLQQEGSSAYGLEIKEEETLSVPESKDHGEEVSSLPKETTLHQENLEEYEPINDQQSPVEEKSDEVIQVSSASPSEEHEGGIIVNAVKLEDIIANEEEQVVEEIQRSLEPMEPEEHEQDTVSERIEDEKVKEEEPIVQISSEEDAIKSHVTEADNERLSEEAKKGDEETDVRETQQGETIVNEAESVDTSTVQEATALKTLETKINESEAVRSGEEEERQVTKEDTEPRLDLKEEKEQEETEAVILSDEVNKDESQGREESVEVKYKEKDANLLDVPSENMQRPSLESPSEVSEKTSKTVDKKIEEKTGEEVTLHQESQETKEETVTVPESSELGVQVKEEEEEEEPCPPNEQKNETKEQMSEEDNSPMEEKSDQGSSAPLSEEREAEKIEDLKENEKEEPVEASRPDVTGSSKLVEEEELKKDKEILEAEEVPSSETIPQETPSDATAVQLKREVDATTTESHEEEATVAQTRDIIETSLTDQFSMDQEEEQAKEESPRNEHEKVISSEEGETQTRELEEENMVDSTETKKEDEDKTVVLDASKTSENECTKKEEIENLETPKVEDKSQEVSETIQSIESIGDQSPSFITELEDQIPKQIKEIHEEEIKEAQAVVDQTSSLVSEQVEEEEEEEETKESRKVEAMSGQDLPVEASHAHQTPSSELDDKTPKQVEEIHQEETKAHKLQEEEILLPTERVSSESFSETQEERHVSAVIEESVGETKPKESDDQIETSTKVTKVEDTQVAEILKGQSLSEDASLEQEELKDLGTLLQPGVVMEDQDSVMKENSSDDSTFSKSIGEAEHGDDNSSTLPVVGILKELQTTLEENERGNDLNSINAEPDTLEKSLVVGATPASEIIEANMLQDSISRELEVNVEETLQQETREIAECKEETPADLSLTEVLPGEKILIPSKQEEGKKQEDANASTSEKISLQEEEHPRDSEISNQVHNAEAQETVKEEDQTFDSKEEKKNEVLQDEKLSTLSATSEAFSPEMNNNNNNNQEDASELGVDQSVLGNDQKMKEVLTSENKITEPLSVAEKELTKGHVQPQAVLDDTQSSNDMDFTSEKIPNDQRDEAVETADALITSEKVQLQDQFKGVGQEKQSTDEIKDEGHVSVLAHKKDSDLIEEKKEVDFVKTEQEDAIKHGVSTEERNLCEKIGQEATKEIYQEECKQTDTATAIKEEIKQEEKETTEDSLNSTKNTDEKIKDYGLDSVVARKNESGSIEEKKEVDYVKTEQEGSVKHEFSTEENKTMSGNIGHEATKEIYEEERKQTNTVTAIKEEIKEEKKETPEDVLNSIKNTEDATEKTKPEIQEIDKLSPVSETPPKQGDEVPTQQRREIADDVLKVENLKIAEEVQQKYGEDETEPIVKEPARKSLSDLIQNVKVTDKTEVATTEPRIHEEAKAEEGEDEDGDEHKDDKTSPDSIVMVEAKDTVSIIKTQKKSHGILSGVGSKVKHSISKVKKALTGKSSHPTKPSSPQ
ncbi:hypothetical protein Bca52824_007948 [Brassica carinata]|uniref:Uncharacterized protein n=1 Tax=Brassica carinata TaxID=52824 RepID=A0A8X7W9Y7_BRACI|nr:hypothetical protein Bca52824_007948 [Brassica carinata]